MYRSGSILDGIKNPKKGIEFLTSAPRRVAGTRLNKWYGEKVLKKYWYNLIILDGCREDVFAESVSMEGDLTSIRSCGSSSYEYFVNNFGDGRYPEVVYITANTWIHKIDAEFYNTFHLREQIWDEEAKTVLPSDFVNFVLELENKYRNKRLILHMMQPHMPFLTETENGFHRLPVSESSGLSQGDSSETTESPPWWIRLKQGDISRQEAWDAYKTTLNVTLPHVRRLVEGIPGKTVISADHGNGFGEDGIYGHPHNRAHQSLVKVPWFVVEDERKTIIPGKQTVTTGTDDVDEDKLRALGYLE